MACDRSVDLLNQGAISIAFGILSKELEATTNYRHILPESTKSTSKDLSSVRLAATETNPLVTLA